jgi:RNA polymerase sigma factor (sigma-70 family)
MNADSLTSLWNSFRSGSEAAYTCLMEAFANPLYRYGIRFVHDEDFIKDCIQDVFFELWNRREKISSTPFVKSYLFKALRQRIFREQSKWNDAEPLDENYQFAVELDTETAMIELQSSEEVKFRMAKILNDLPRRQREILYLRFYEELDQHRIAEIMGLNPQSAYNLLHESILRLRKHWLKEVQS